MEGKREGVDGELYLLRLECIGAWRSGAGWRLWGRWILRKRRMGVFEKGQVVCVGLT